MMTENLRKNAYRLKGLNPLPNTSGSSAIIPGWGGMSVLNIVWIVLSIAVAGWFQRIIDAGTELLQAAFQLL